MSNTETATKIKKILADHIESPDGVEDAFTDICDVLAIPPITQQDEDELTADKRRSEADDRDVDFTDDNEEIILSDDEL